MYSKETFLKTIAERILVTDGAMGSELTRRGMPAGHVPELWNVGAPEKIREVHQAYIDAGCEGILTNTFGCTRLRLDAAGLGERGAEFARAAVAIVRDVAEGKAFVFGDIGPSGHGDKMEPYGTMKPDVFESSFRELAASLAEAGAHAIYIETMASVVEAAIAVRAAKAETDLPVVASLTFKEPPESRPDDFRTFWGDTVAAATEQLVDAGADLIGMNCGEVVDRAPDLAALLAQATDKPLAFQPNAGAPTANEDGSASYGMTPEDFGRVAVRLAEANVRVIGGCCGTTPDHMAAAKKAVAEIE